MVWATNNKNDNMVRLLLEQGASTTAQTAKGHTVVDFLRHDPNDNTRIVQIFQEPGRRDSISSTGSLVRQASSIGDDLFYQAGIEGFEEMMAENERRYKMAMESANAFDVDMADLSLADQVRTLFLSWRYSTSSSTPSTHTLQTEDGNSCLFDQDIPPFFWSTAVVPLVHVSFADSAHCMCSFP